MSDLTREEIRSACEAVGWNLYKSGVIDDGRHARFCRFMLDRFDHQDQSMDDAGMDDADAIALLEATSTDYTIWRRKLAYHHSSQGPDFVVETQWGDGEVVAFGPDLPTAAVRAVNEWTKTKK